LDFISITVAEMSAMIAEAAKVDNKGIFFVLIIIIIIKAIIIGTVVQRYLCCFIKFIIFNLLKI